MNRATQQHSGARPAYRVVTLAAVAAVLVATLAAGPAAAGGMRGPEAKRAIEKATEAAHNTAGEEAEGTDSATKDAQTHIEVVEQRTPDKAESGAEGSEEQDSGENHIAIRITNNGETGTLTGDEAHSEICEHFAAAREEVIADLRDSAGEGPHARIKNDIADDFEKTLLNPDSCKDAGHQDSGDSSSEHASEGAPGHHEQNSAGSESTTSHKDASHKGGSGASSAEDDSMTDKEEHTSASLSSEDGSDEEEHTSSSMSSAAEATTSSSMNEEEASNEEEEHTSSATSSEEEEHTSSGASGVTSGAEDSSDAEDEDVCDTTASEGDKVQKLVDSLKAGQTGCLEEGTYTEEEVEFEDGGARNKRMVLRSVPGEEATLEGSIYVPEGSDYVSIADMRIDASENDPDGPSSSQAIRIMAEHTNIRGNDITNHRPDVDPEDAGSCILLGEEGRHAEDTNVKGNRIHQCGNTDSEDSNGHGLYVSHASDTRIVDNLVYDNAASGIQLYPDSRDSRVEGNVLDANEQNLLVNDGSPDNTASGNVFSNPTDSHNVKVGDGEGNKVTGNCLWSEGGESGFEPAENVSASENVTAGPQYEDRESFEITNPGCLEKYSGSMAAKDSSEEDSSDLADEQDVGGPTSNSSLAQDDNDDSDHDSGESPVEEDSSDLSSEGEQIASAFASGEEQEKDTSSSISGEEGSADNRKQDETKSVYVTLRGWLTFSD